MSSTRKDVLTGTRVARLLVVALLVAATAGPAAAAETTLVPLGAVFTYLDDGTDQGVAWTAVDFDDGGWAAGPAELGYGDGDEATVVGFGPDPNDKYPTTYFRHAFTVPDPGAFVSLQLRLRRDDGAVVHLNGSEVYRNNMPDGPIDFLTLADSTVSGDEEDEFVTAFLDPAELLSGANVLAVEIHQRTRTSSDISMDVELVGSDTAFGVVRGPYLQLGTDRSVVVRWSTDIPTDGRVRFGLAPDALERIADGQVQSVDHEVELTGLSPQTLYYYGVGTPDELLGGADLDHFFVTSPRPVDARPVRVWVIGDSGTADASARAVRDAYRAFDPARHTDLWLMLGDNAYEDGTDEEYQRAVFETYPEILRSTALFSTLGNHDGHSADSLTQTGPYYDIFTLPSAAEAGGVPSGTEAYYSFDFGNVHFICLDSYDSDRDVGAPMLTWLEDDLAGNDARWTVAFWHHPPYSKGSHDSDTEGALIDMRENAVALLEDYGVDLVFSGHSHAYERSFLLDSHYGLSTELDDSMKIDDGDGRLDGDGPYEKPTLGPTPHEGAVFVVAGSSGKTSGGPLDHPVMIESLDELGSVVLDVNGDALRLRFVRDDGAVADRFTLLKAGASVPIELTLSPATARPGETVALTVSGAEPGERVLWAQSVGLGEGPCLDGLGGLCLDIARPVDRRGVVRANAAGVATLSVTIPSDAAPGRRALQAAVARGVDGAESLKSHPVLLTVTAP